MSKQEFIEKLRSSLSGQVPAGMVEENVAYYEDYINSQIRLGQPETVIMQNLGDPRLIAKSIITANTGEEYVDDGRNGYREWSVNEERFYAENRKEKLEAAADSALCFAGGACKVRLRRLGNRHDRGVRLA